MSDPVWYCVRQVAGPLVKECRAIRPRLSVDDTLYDRRLKNRILRPPRDSAVCHSPVDRLELRMALFGYRGTFYTLTFDPDHLPPDWKDGKRLWRNFVSRCRYHKKKQNTVGLYRLPSLNTSTNILLKVSACCSLIAQHLKLIARSSYMAGRRLRWLNNQQAPGGLRPSWRREE